MWELFEFIIYIFLISSGVFLIEVFSRWKKLKRKSLFVCFSIIFLILWIVVFYGSFVEPKRLVVNEQFVELPESSGHLLRAVVISDIHVGPYKDSSWVEKVVTNVNELEPDVVFIIGDFIFSKSEQSKMLGPLKNLSAKYGVFAVTGNHDYIGLESEKIVAALNKLGVRVLENESLRLFKDRSLVLSGVSDIWFEGNPYEALKGVLEKDQVVLLSHNPDIVYSSVINKADLVISAHTHGGQVRLPWIGPISPLPTQLGRKYDKGLFSFKDIPLFITSGVSETGSRARLFNPPEIVLLNINY